MNTPLETGLIEWGHLGLSKSSALRYPGTTFRRTPPITKEITLNTKEQYTAPELKLVGQASDVVMGMTDIGSDYAGEIYIPSMDFQAD